MKATELRDWQRRNGYRSQKEAAAALGISEITYHRKLHGRAPITPQTELLCSCIEIRQNLDVEALAHLSDLINKLIRLALAKRRVDQLHRGDNKRSHGD
jgi:hypothetical protein